MGGLGANGRPEASYRTGQEESGEKGSQKTAAQIRREREGGVGTTAAKRLCSTHAYLDHLYSEIGKGLHEEASYLPAVFIVVPIIFFSICAAIVSATALIRKTQFADFLLSAILPPPDTAHRHRRMWLILIMSTFDALAYADCLFAMSYQHKTVIWIERSIEIIRPQISDSKFLELRAMYRSASDAQSFFKLWDNLNAIAEKSELKLPKYKPYGRNQ